MSIWGKLAGAAAGLAVGGPIGALLGGVAGHYAIDRGQAALIEAEFRDGCLRICDRRCAFGRHHAALKGDLIPDPPGAHLS
jgi:hypothetical protein